MKKITTLLLTCAFTITNNSFGMEESSKQSQYLSELLEKNNQLLGDIKKQNQTIIKLNYLHYQYVTELVQNNSNHNHYSEKQYALGSQIAQTYTAQCAIDKLERTSNENK